MISGSDLAYKEASNLFLEFSENYGKKIKIKKREKKTDIFYYINVVYFLPKEKPKVVYYYLRMNNDLTALEFTQILGSCHLVFFLSRVFATNFIP